MNHVLVMISPVGDWERASERAIAAGADICFQTYGIEGSIKEFCAQALSLFKQNIFGFACRDLQTARNLDALPEVRRFSGEDSLSAILPWGRASAEDVSGLNYIKPLPSLGSIKDVESFSQHPWNLDPDQSVLIRGYEAGGLCGSDSQYILIQKALSHITKKNIIVSGPLGLLCFGALNNLGVNSIILDEQTLLLEDSYLPENHKSLLKRVNGRQSVVLRSSHDEEEQFRCILLPGRGGPNYLFGSTVEAKELQGSATWSSEWMFPLGEGIDFAKDFAIQYRTLGRLISAYQDLDPVKPSVAESPNTVAHQFGVRYPIIQGPMSRVSDNGKFAASVAEGGALPTIAAAMLTAEALEAILLQTDELIPNQPWGVGLLGFIDSSHLQAQIDVLKRSKASFCILAGGTPAQAKNIASDSLRVFIHAPTPELLGLFIKEGWRDFILEGRECGGHIGPLSSLTLWERSIQVVLNQSTAVSRTICLVLAGGIHDQTSAAFAAYIINDLQNAGASSGILVGSAYLATREIVADCAIKQAYQDVALQCSSTVFLETAPGHQSRCADTAFSREFNSKRDELIRAQVPSRDMSRELDGLILGRLRLASKGLQRQDGKLVEASEEEQLLLGMYMLGESVCLINNATSIAQLHESIQAGLDVVKTNTLPQDRINMPTNPRLRGEKDIAVIGMSCKLPGANNPSEFWDLVLRARGQIQEIPPERWSISDFYSSDRNESHKIHSKWGAFLDAIDFDPLEFGIPPQSIASIDPAQLLALICVKEALINAGYPEESKFDRDSTGVILGYSGGLGELGQGYVLQSELAPLLERNPQIDELLPSWTSDSFAGILPNVSAGRVANRFNLGGTNCTVDAACASSLAALDVGIHKLRQGDLNMALVGAIDTLQSPFAYFCFSETQALSPTGRAKSFTSEADGIVLGEGAGILVLKRLEDAESDGDTIYAVIKGIGSSSDGRGRTMTAPSHQGQIQAFARAYADADLDPSILSYYEAHGTGTPVGDRSEILALTSFLESHSGSEAHCAVGSVKTLIGHTKSTAGFAGLLKAILALKSQIIPLHTEPGNHINEVINSANVYLPVGNRPWLLGDHSRPRVAGVSAFGFGGTNFHVVLQEYKRSLHTPEHPYELPPRFSSGHHLLYLCSKTGTLLDRITAALKDTQRIKEEYLQNECSAPLNAKIIEILVGDNICNHNPSDRLEYAFLLIDLSRSDLCDKLETALLLLRGEIDYNDPLREWLVCESMFSGLTIQAKQESEIALLFPGQGSDYPGMGKTCMAIAPLISHDLLVRLIPNDKDRSLLIENFLFGHPGSSDSIPAEYKQALLAITELSYLEILHYLDIPWSVAIGHSLGDFASLCACGFLTSTQLVDTLLLRGKAVSSFYKDGYGMLILFTDVENAQNLLDTSKLQSVVLANINSPNQIVLSGQVDDLKQIEALALTNGIASQRMDSRYPFHSPFMIEANNKFKQALAELSLQSATPSTNKKSILSTAPDSGLVNPDNCIDLLSTHMVSSVDFITSLQRSQELGCNTFIEVGPKKVLTKLAQSIFKSPDAKAIALDGIHGSSDLLASIMRLASLGIPLNWKRLSDLVEQHPSFRSMGSTSPKHHSRAFKYYVNGANAWKSGARQLNNGQHNVHRAISDAIDDKSSSSPDDYSSIKTVLPSPEMHQQPQGSNPMNEPTKVSNIRLEAFRTYHETLRMMIHSQNQVFSSFLSGSTIGIEGIESDAISSPPSPIYENSNSLSIPHNQHSLDSLSLSRQNSPQPPEVLEEPSKPPTSPNGKSVTQLPPPQIQENVQSPVLDSSTQFASTSKNSTSGVDLQRQPEADPAAILDQLTKLLSEKSGYPPELLDPDQDLESDLGIDSIKRIEVMGGFLSSIPDVSAESVQAIQTGTRDLRTLREVATHIASVFNASHAPIAQEAPQPGKPQVG